MKRWWLIGLGAAVMAGLIGAGFGRFVESQIFFPDRVLAARPSDFDLPSEDIRFPASDGVELHGWLIPAAGADTLLLFSHGNAGNISHRLDNLSRLHRLRIDVFIYDYRGYGLSQGRISLAGFELDARAALAWAARRAEERKQRLVLFGRSLGGAAAVIQAAGGGVDGIILESTFTSLADMARVHFPIPGLGKTVAGKLDSLSRIGRITAPLLMIHGDEDDIVPAELGRRLFEAAPQPKELIIIPEAGHNDTYEEAGPEYFQRLAAFISGLHRRH